MSEIIIIVLQGVSALTILKAAIVLGKVLQQVEQHEAQIKRIEDRLF